MSAQASLLPPPPTVMDVLWQRRTIHQRDTVLTVLAVHGIAAARVAQINDWAISDGVNLAIPLGRADADLIRWVERALERKPRSNWAYPPQHRPTSWRLARELAGLIDRHRHLITSTSAPPDAWAIADREMWDALAAARADEPELRRQAR